MLRTIVTITATIAVVKLGPELKDFFVKGRRVSEELAVSGRGWRSFLSDKHLAEEGLVEYASGVPLEQPMDVNAATPVAAKKPPKRLPRSSASGFEPLRGPFFILEG
jgi:hypothetical protein